MCLVATLPGHNSLSSMPETPHQQAPMVPFDPLQRWPISVTPLSDEALGELHADVLLLSDLSWRAPATHTTLPSKLLPRPPLFIAAHPTQPLRRPVQPTLRIPRLPSPFSLHRSELYPTGAVYSSNSGELFSSCRCQFTVDSARPWSTDPIDPAHEISIEK
jgi:hypothetical protein